MYLFYDIVGLWSTQKRHCPVGWQRHLSWSPRIFEICEEQPTLWEPILPVLPGVHQSRRWPGEICLLRMRKISFYKQMCINGCVNQGRNKGEKNKPIPLKYPMFLSCDAMSSRIRQTDLQPLQQCNAVKCHCTPFLLTYGKKRY